MVRILFCGVNSMKELKLESYDNVWTRMQKLEADQDDKNKDTEIVFWKVGGSEAVFAKRVDGQFQVFELEQEFEADSLEVDDENLNHLETVEEGSRDDVEALEFVCSEIYSRGGTIVVQDASDLKSVDTVQKAKILKRELNLRFPDQKFSVKTERYSGGSSINVSWEDGIAEDDVQEVTDKYQYVYPDQDLQSGYHHDDNKVFTKRSISEEAKEKVASEILEKFAEDVFDDRHWHDNRFTSEYHQKVKKTSFVERDDGVELEA